ncbi:HGxxPAAW family protein [Actinacidiphila yeochonensis]|uniref:HGxxPAAW family protein n=1 Tax=Actinacidiphila yeochonensis TaxID=89050 RepID=UPI0005626AF7|nr:HGxxPAAW family protein [Actinacidiphila yeochonensis]
MAEAHGHGHTPAAWTGVIIAFIGFCVGGAFMVADNTVGFWVGIALIAVGALVGGIMKLMGLGQKYEPIETSPVRAGSTEAREHARA